MIIISRSYKKTPWSGDKKGKDKKRMANKKIRSYLKQHPEESIPKNFHKKYYETWDICDFGWQRTWEEYWQRCWDMYYQMLAYSSDFQSIEEPDETIERKRWLKYFRNK